MINVYYRSVQLVELVDFRGENFWTTFRTMGILKKDSLNYNTNKSYLLHDLLRHECDTQTAGWQKKNNDLAVKT